MQKKNTLQIASLITWFILLVGMIILLPNSLSWNSSYSQQLPTDSAPSATIVYTNKDGALTTTQKKAIQTNQKKLRANQKFLGIQSVEIDNDPSSTQRLDSADKSTVLNVLHFKQSQKQFHILIPQIYSLIQTPGVHAYITGNDVLQIARVQAIQTANKLVIIICCVLTTLIIGILFRSILAPLIALLLSGIVYLTSFSIATLAARFLNTPYTAYTNTIMVVVSFGLVPIIISIFYRRYCNHYENQNAVRTLYWDSWLPSLLSIFPLAIVGTVLLLAKNLTLRSLWILAVALLIAWIVFYTLMPAMTEFLDDLFFWPGDGRNFNPTSTFWQFSTAWGKHHALISLGSIFILFLLGTFIKTTPLNWSSVIDTPFSSQAKIGATVISSHYPIGKVSPITVTMTNKKSTLSTKNMAVINQLAEKLKTNKKVANVYSIAQPGGTPFTNLYVNKQLANVTSQLAAANLNLTNTQKSLKNSQKQLKDLNLKTALKQLTKNASNLSKIQSQSSQVADQASELTNDIDTIQSQQTELTRILKSENSSTVSVRRALSALNTQSKNLINDLKTLRHNIQVISSNNNVIADNISQVEDDQQSVTDDFQTAQTILKNTDKDLTKDSKNVQIAQQNLIGEQSFLGNLSNSGILNILYMTPQNLRTTPMKNAIGQFNKTKNKITVISIVLNTESASNAATTNLNQIKHLISSTLSGTSLSISSVSYSGDTVYVAQQKQALNHDITHLLPWLVGFVVIYLLLLSQSLFAIYASISLLIAFFGSLQITNWFSNILLKTPLVADVPLISGLLLLCLGLGFLVPTILRTTRCSTDNYLGSLNQFDPFLILIGMFEFALLLALGFTQLLSFIQIALVMFVTTLIWESLFPVGIAATLHLTYDKS
ncbi:MMPL family transporter [Pediococcus ethanolidurans]